MLKGAFRKIGYFESFQIITIRKKIHKKTLMSTVLMIRNVASNLFSSLFTVNKKTVSRNLSYSLRYFSLLKVSGQYGFMLSHCI